MVGAPDSASNLNQSLHRDIIGIRIKVIKLRSWAKLAALFDFTGLRKVPQYQSSLLHLYSRRRHSRVLAE